MNDKVQVCWWYAILCGSLVCFSSVPLNPVQFSSVEWSSFNSRWNSIEITNDNTNNNNNNYNEQSKKLYWKHLGGIVGGSIETTLWKETANKELQYNKVYYWKGWQNVCCSVGIYSIIYSFARSNRHTHVATTRHYWHK